MKSSSCRASWLSPRWTARAPAFSVRSTRCGSFSGDVTFVPIQLPIGEKHDYKGVIDLFSMTARSGAGEQQEPIPADLQAEAEAARLRLVEAAAEGDDSLLEKYLNGESLSDDEVKRGFRAAVRSGRFVPVLTASGTACIGGAPLLEAVLSLLPSPADAPPAAAAAGKGEESLPASDTGPLAVYVWKTTADPFVGKLTYLRVYSSCSPLGQPALGPDQEQ